ncbi:hypothetical protein V6Z12_D06G101000 [Gossypium hirsutum]
MKVHAWRRTRAEAQHARGSLVGMRRTWRVDGGVVLEAVRF